MRLDYNEISLKMGTPLWYDCNGVPRYVECTPEGITLYGDYAVLMHIRCQSCGKNFIVSVAPSRYGENRLPTPENEGDFYYGVPPVHGCTGDSMMSTSIRIIRFWRRDRDWAAGWQRDKRYEIDFKEE